MNTSGKALILITVLSCTVLLSCDVKGTIEGVDQAAEAIKQSGLYSDIKAQPLLSSLVLGLIAAIIIVIGIHIPIKQVQLSPDEKKRLSFLQVLHRFFVVSDPKIALFNRIFAVVILVVAVLVSLACIKIILPAPIEDDNNNGPPDEEIVEIRGFKFTPNIKNERHKGCVMFSSQPEIEITCAYKAKPESCIIFFCYPTDREAGHWVVLGEGREVPKGWIRGDPEFLEPTSPSDYKRFKIKFKPTAYNNLFKMDLNADKVSKSHLYVNAVGSANDTNYQRLREEAWDRYKEVIKEYRNLEDPDSELHNYERIEFFHPVYDVPLSEILEEKAIWYTEGQDIKTDPESETILIKNVDADSTIRFKNNDNLVPYPFGVRFKIEIDKARRPSALVICLGNQSPTFIELKLQSLISPEDKYKLIIREKGIDVTSEWLKSNKPDTNEWPISWENLDIRLYAYDGKTVTLTVNDGTNSKVFTYKVKDEGFKNGKGSRFALRIEEKGAEVKLSKLYIFHFDPERMDDYESL